MDVIFRTIARHAR